MWFKVDDKLHDHRKARAAGAAAMGLWVLAGSWAADNLTDGFIPAALLTRWGRPRDAKRLVDVGLWHADEQDGEQGWRFHEWHERQPSRAQKLAEREMRAEAGRIGGKASGRSRREANPKQSASQVVEPPTRPDPTRTTDVPDGTSERADKPPTARKRASALPDDFQPNDTNLRVANECRVNLAAILPQFLDHHRAKGSTFKDWHAALNTWIRREKPSAAEPARLPLAHDLELPPDGLSDEEYATWQAEQRRRRA